jgi:hypothetical protein
MLRRGFSKEFLVLRIFAATSIATIVSASPAMAYLDPVSGSMISQLVLGGVTGLVVVAKLYWRRFLRKVALFQSGGKNSRGA